MKCLFASFLFALVTACGTGPPLPPQCEGELTPINAPTSMSGTAHESRSGA